MGYVRPFSIGDLRQALATVPGYCTPLVPGADGKLTFVERVEVTSNDPTGAGLGASSVIFWPLLRTQKESPMTLPDIEVVSARVHEAWMAAKAAQGVTSRKAEDGEELIAPYEALSEQAKELDRGTVRAVYAAIHAADTVSA